MVVHWCRLVGCCQVDVAKQAFHSEDAVEEEEEEVEREASPKAVGHNIFILAHQLSQHNKDLAARLTPSGTDPYGDQALNYYAKHTAQIEVSHTAQIEVSHTAEFSIPLRES
jgi:hypothetical protein